MDSHDLPIETKREISETVIVCCSQYYQLEQKKQKPSSQPNCENLTEWEHRNIILMGHYQPDSLHPLKSISSLIQTGSSLGYF